MKSYFFIIILLITGVFACSNNQTKTTITKEPPDSIVKIEMNLSAFGVESDNFPSIAVIIDFVNDSNRCVKSFYNPDYKGATYSLTKAEMNSILNLLKMDELEKAKKKYTSDMSDQPTSTTIIYTTKKKLIFEDCGLEGQEPLQSLYKLVYKF